MPSAEALDVVIPTSHEEAAKVFGDGKGVTIIGGGTIVVPDITYGRLRPGKGGERTEPVEEFLAGGSDGRLVLDVSYDAAQRRAGYAAARRPHAHHYTILAVAAAEMGGALRVAASGLAPHAVRLTAVEQSRDPLDALGGAEP